MSGERRFIVVDTSATNKRDDARYFGPNGWGQTIREAGTFTTTEAAEHEARREFIFGAPFIRIRPVVPAGTKRARAVATHDKATHWLPAGDKECCMVALAGARIASTRDEVTCKNCIRHLESSDTAAIRAELDGLRATDAEMASRVAMAEQQTTGWATAYHSASEREERVRRALGARGEEATDEAAKRVAGERDEAVRELGELRRAIEVLIAQARA